jgi:hypothetical protein
VQFLNPYPAGFRGQAVPCSAESLALPRPICSK